MGKIIQSQKHLQLSNSQTNKTTEGKIMGMALEGKKHMAKKVHAGFKMKIPKIKTKKFKHKR